MKRTIFSEEHDLFRAEFRRFVETEFLPHGEEWHEAGISPRWAWEKMGENGFLGANQPEEYGGAGGDFLFDAIIMEELADLRLHSLQASLHTPCHNGNCGRHKNRVDKGNHAPVAGKTTELGINRGRRCTGEVAECTFQYISECPSRYNAVVGKYQYAAEYGDQAQHAPAF